jgi:hypothetical protein
VESLAVDGKALQTENERDPPGELLMGWKEIADYLHRSVRTVQRWERRTDLPVRNFAGDRVGSVFALIPEVNEWLLRWSVRRSDSSRGC